MHFQPLLGSRRANQAHDDFQGFERYSLPVAGDVAEEPVLDLVPLAGARWVVTDLDLEARLIGELLQCPTPQPRSWAVAAATVGGDQQAFRAPMALSPQPFPPAADRCHGELG